MGAFALFFLLGAVASATALIAERPQHFRSIDIDVSVAIGVMDRRKPGNGNGNNSTGGYSHRQQCPVPASPLDAHRVRVNLTEGSVLHVWMQTTALNQIAALFGRRLPDERNASVLALDWEGEQWDAQWFDFYEIAMNYEGPVELSWSPRNTRVSYIYAFEPEQVQEAGIRPVYIAPVARLPPVPASFHFWAPLGWINDPCGFSRSTDGVYHLFYQHYPHSIRAWRRYWGHAVSHDLVNWVHLPIFLQPRKAHEDGGIFSGSAVPVPGGGLRAYYTERVNHTIGRPVLEYQRSVPMKDGYRPLGPSPDAITARPPELVSVLTEDWRDPNVFLGPGGAQFLTLGSRWADASGGAILLYKQNASVAEASGNGGAGWQYQSIVHNETRWGIVGCECSGFIPLGDPASNQTKWALIFAADGSKDEEGRRNISPIRVGTFDGHKFVLEFEQELDYFVGSYAYQGYHDPVGNQSLVIGWLGNWPDYNSSMDFPTAMTLPRVIRKEPNQNWVTIGPHPFVTSLRVSERAQDSARLAALQPVQLPTGTGEIQFQLESNTSVRTGGRISLAMNHTQWGPNAITLSLFYDAQQGYYAMQLNMAWKNATAARYIARGAQPSEVRVFVDLGSVEVFADNGRWSGTARIPGTGRVESVQLVAANSTVLRSATIWELKSTQPQFNTLNA